MSLVSECLESLGVYSFNEPVLPIIDSDKYTMESGVFQINMESIDALDEIYKTNYELEALGVHAVHNAKMNRVPIYEGFGEFKEKIKKKASEYWEKIKKFFKELKEKIKAWFENVKRLFRQMLMKPEEFVSKYKTEITSVDGSDPKFAGQFRIFNYTINEKLIDAKCTVYQKYAEQASELVNKAVESASKYKGAKSDTANYKVGDNSNDDAVTKQGEALKTIDNEGENLKKTYISEINTKLKSLLADKEEEYSEDEIKKVWSSLRGGATSEDDKVVPSSIDLAKQVSYVSESKNMISKIESAKNKVVSILDRCIQNVDKWKNAFDSADGDVSAITGVLTQFTNGMSNTKSMVTKVADVVIKAVTERASVAYQICKKALDFKYKKEKKERKDKS